jgi:HSP20 family protein
MKKDRYPIRRQNTPIDPFDNLFDNFFPWQHRGSPFRLFDDFDKQFNRIRQNMNTLFDQYQKGELPPPEKGGPFVYGYSFRVGPDGKPHFEEFGNTKSIPTTHQQQQIPSSREPLVDGQESENNLIYDIEIPGVVKSEIDLEATNDMLIINVNNSERPYYKEIPLPTDIDPDSADVSFNNGILSISLKKLQQKTKGKKLNIK